MTLLLALGILNGGNGSARLNAVRFLSDNEIEMIPESRFVSYNVKIEATQDVIWEVLTNPENAKFFRPIFDEDKKLKSNWTKNSNVNYNYPNTGSLTSSYAGELFGNFYIQNEITKSTELKVVCGPFGDDFETQKTILSKWVQKVKELSEK